VLAIFMFHLLWLGPAHLLEGLPVSKGVTANLPMPRS
jgi:hypothetical protein